MMHAVRVLCSNKSLADDLLARARREAGGDGETFADLARLEIRGLYVKMTVWALS